MNITIDPNSGFCFGVVYTIQMAEEELDKSGGLYCLGDIVHNNKEVERLTKKGLKIIDYDQYRKLKDCKVLIRAHGEPPETYKTALQNNIELVDASCPVVLKLQHRVRNGYDEATVNSGQIVIYGKPGHAEVNGLVGQTEDMAIIVTTFEDLDKIDYSKPVYFFSQTTKSTDGFTKMANEIQKRIDAKGSNVKFIANDTICRQVSNREPQLRIFAKEHDAIIFVSGQKSSNGKVLYNVCKEENQNSYFISEAREIQNQWFINVKSVGICGATSTPRWLMEEVSDYLNTPIIPA
jgi:4-hydroxy-3-methylbut-2-enyl diphosphate reductase